MKPTEKYHRVRAGKRTHALILFFNGTCIELDGNDSKSLAKSLWATLKEKKKNECYKIIFRQK